ncbi:MAG: hypothetical protein ACK4MV_18960 [Beijerinckiaceae bacterium]
MRPAVVLPDRLITFEMLRTGIGSAQCVLATLGLGRDHLVGLLVDNPVRHLSLRIPLVTPGGAQNPPDFIDRIRMTFGSQVIDSYTSTESGHMAFAADEVLDLRRSTGSRFVPVAHIGHPKIADVAVVRMNVPGESPAAWLAVVARDALAPEEVFNWMQRNAGSELGFVSFAKFFTVNQIPRTPLGKVARNALRDQLQAMPG